MDLLTVSILTQRLVLRPLASEDWRSILREFTPEITSRMCAAPVTTPDQARRFVIDSLQRLRAGTDFRAAVTLASTGAFIGLVSLEGLQTDGPEFGIWIAKDHQGLGYGKEAVQGMHSWALDNLETRSFVYPVDRDNTPSVKIAQALGGVMTGELLKRNHNGRELHLHQYRIAPSR